MVKAILHIGLQGRRGTRNRLGALSLSECCFAPRQLNSLALIQLDSSSMRCRLCTARLATSGSTQT